jgi:hypothetical protein
MIIGDPPPAHIDREKSGMEVYHQIDAARPPAREIHELFIVPCGRGLALSNRICRLFRLPGAAISPAGTRTTGGAPHDREAPHIR